MLTGVYEDKRSRIEGGHWIAVWKVETTRGANFYHLNVDGFRMTRDEAMFAAANNPPEAVVRLRKAS